jgi:hypothetical protein
MAFDKSILKKIAEEVTEKGVTSSRGKDLRKAASSMRIAYLTAFIRNKS